MTTAVTEKPGTMPLTDRRDALADCAAALREMHAVLYQCPSGDLAGLAGDLAELRALAGAALAEATAEATVRGVIDASQSASVAAWVADRAWHSRREASTLAKTATILSRPDLQAVADAIRQVDIDPATAVAVAREYDTLKPDLRDDAHDVVLEQFLAVGAEHGPAGVHRLGQEILARYGENGEFEDHQERCRRHIDLSAGRQSSPGVWNYRFTTDNEGRAVLEAAIGPLSAPTPNPQTGQADPRPVGRRRGEALTEALRRSLTAAQHVPTSPKAILMLTVGFQDLAAGIAAATAPGSRAADTPLTPGTDTAHGTGAARVAGSRAAGTPIAPDTARKIACDAGILPVVLGGDSEILDLGRMQRLFTTGQVRALWLRDGHCTFDGCDIPAAWCDSHHLRHWIDGGPTDLGNAALLCPRHHTIVHRDQLAGTLTTTDGNLTTTDGTGTGAHTRIVWDLRPGSYRPPEIRLGAPPGDPPGAQPGIESGARSGARPGGSFRVEPSTQPGNPPGAQARTQSRHATRRSILNPPGASRGMPPPCAAHPQPKSEDPSLGQSVT